MNVKFRVQFLEEASEFLDDVHERAREKIIYNIKKSQVINDNELFKKLNTEIWEFRTLHMKMKYRLLAFWDKSENIDTIVIATHGIIKKTDKVPLSDIDKAERIKRLYFEQKAKGK